MSSQDKPSKARADELIEWLRSYANERINSRLIDERRCIPPYIVLDMGNRGLLGMQVPPKYGGIGLSNQDTLRVIQQLGAIDPTLASFVGVHNVLGIRPLMNYASSEVRDELLPLMATGRELAAFALTEPGAGSNPQAISAKAIPDSQGSWRLQGTKVWIGSAAWASAINVFVQTFDAEGQYLGISGFVVRQGSSGLRQGPEALTMGLRGMVQNTVYLDDVSVDSEHLLGELGTGMKAAQDAMMHGRLCITAASLGGMKRCAQLMLRYAKRRNISTGRLLNNPVTLAKLTDITEGIMAVESLVESLNLDKLESFVVRRSYIRRCDES
jgi:alkylation response protein AidB-like acyl-CoA dehydrogenase